MNLIITSKEDLKNFIQQAVKSAVKHCFSEQQRDESPPDQIYGIKKAAEVLGIAIPTIYAKTSKGEIPHFKKGKKLYFRHSELMDWIEAGRQSTLQEDKAKLKAYLVQKEKGGQK
ncbi:MAG: helix-turn-helix domain-containing protein [Bacteroidota bacterium]